MSKHCLEENPAWPSKESVVATADSNRAAQIARRSIGELSSKTSDSNPEVAGSVEKADLASLESRTLDAREAQLDVKISLLGLCGIALTTGESWVALGNSLVSCSSLPPGKRRHWAMSLRLQ